MTTITQKKMEHVIDAANQSIGRLASRVATILQGKLHPTYEQRMPGADSVIIKNAGKVKITPKKATQKIFYRHTGYMGHLKELPLKIAFEKDPIEVIRRTIKMMLPQNRLLEKRLKRLRIEK